MALHRLPDPRWNATDAPFPDTLHGHELFESQAALTPDHVALIDGETAYTYSALNALANRLARTLQKRGVGSGSIVGCFLNRSSSIDIATLSVWKAGGAYVLLDSNLPLARLEQIVTDANPTLILTDTVRTSLSLGEHISFASLHEIEEASTEASSDNLAPVGPSTAPAYIAYTSGSTGRPKGVIISHRSTVNHATAFAAVFALANRDRLAIMSALTFDMAIEEMIPPLVSGCTLIVSNAHFESIESFHQEIIDKKLTILNLPASLWRDWVTYLATRKLAIPASVRAVIAGSDEVETKTLRDWLALPGTANVQWAAAYGTTETTVTSTLYFADPADDLTAEAFVPIGKPIANTFTYILDGKLQPVTVGEEGELYIGGAGVAIGYLHADELTRQKFLPNPFHNGPGAHMYKTGDIVRYRPDGNLVWLGRADEQFKINGLRVEPGEIEAVLNRSPQVAQSVAVLQRAGGPTSSKHIVAFVIAKDGATLNLDELQKLAGAYLPSLMVPQRFVQLQSWPLRVNGKIDRTALVQQVDAA